MTEGKISAITINKLAYAYAEKEVLKEITLEVKKGEIFGLLGPSGAGKTTLLKIMTGQLTAEKGEAELFGKKLSDMKREDYLKIGIMMDSFGIYERLNCYDNLKLFAKIKGIETKCIEEILKTVGLWEASKTEASKLSKGMRNRLLLARAFLGEPEIIFLDEPTSGLDPATTAEIHGLISGVKQKGTTVFLTTHNMTEAEKLCDHIALLNEGRIVEQGKPRDICLKYDHQKKLILRFKNGTVRELSCKEDSAEIIREALAGGMMETLHSTEPDLESVFMELTGRKLEV